MKQSWAHTILFTLVVATFTLSLTLSLISLFVYVSSRSAIDAIEASMASGQSEYFCLPTFSDRSSQSATVELG